MTQKDQLDDWGEVLGIRRFWDESLESYKTRMLEAAMNDRRKHERGSRADARVVLFPGIEDESGDETILAERPVNAFRLTAHSEYTVRGRYEATVNGASFFFDTQDEMNAIGKSTMDSNLVIRVVRKRE